MTTARLDTPKLLLVALWCLLCLPGLHAAEPAPPSSAASASPAPKSGSPDPATPQIQAWLRTTGDTATKLFAATEDLKKRTDDRRVFPGGRPEKKAPYLRQQVEELDKQRASLGLEIAKIEEYKAHHLAAWGPDTENLFLEVQISERSIGASLSDLREQLKEQHRWYLLGH